MREVDPKLTAWLESEPRDDQLQLIQSRDGSPNLLINFAGKRQPLYDLADPWAQARRKAAERDRFKEHVTIVGGLGLGYLVRAIIEIMEKGHHIIAIEPNAHLIRLAFELFDYSELLKSKHLIIAAPGQLEVARAIASLEEILLRGETYLVLEEHAELWKHLFVPLVEHANRVTNTVRATRGTALSQGTQIIGNELTALPYLIRQRGVGELIGAFEGKPAILVATGPSLGKNIHLLKKAQGKAVIIAVGQALRALLAYDIKPDLICAIDYGEINMEHYTGLLATRDVPLVALCRTYAPLLRDYQGPLLVVGAGKPKQDYYLSKLWLLKGTLFVGGTVAHLCFSLARLLKADPIIFVGQDLALNDKSHFDQADVGGKIRINQKGEVIWEVDDPASQYHGVTKNYGRAHLVDGYYGGKVISRGSLVSHLTLFERLLENQEGRFINATQGGAKIKGAEPMSLREAIETFCREPLDKTPLQSLSGPAAQGDLLIEQVLPLLKNENEGLEELIRLARRGLATNRGLDRLLGRPDIIWQDILGPYNALLELNTKWSRLAWSAAQSIPTVKMCLAGAENEINRRELNVEFQGDEDSLRTRIERNRYILAAALEKADLLHQTYDQSVDLLERYQACRRAAEESPLDAATRLALGSVLEEMGHFQEAAESCQRAVELAPESLAAWLARARLALRMECHDLFSQALEQVDRLQGDGQDGQSLREKQTAAVAGYWDQVGEDLVQGRFARPLLNARRVLKARPADPQALEAEVQALAIRDRLISRADEELAKLDEAMTGRQGKLLRYQELIKLSREAGRDNKNLELALTHLKEAAELLPEEPQARWGLATTLNLMEQPREALAAYNKLVEDFPDKPRFRYEMGLVLLKLGEIHRGLAEISQVMSQSDNFNSFLSKMGNLYRLIHRPHKALDAYDRYLKDYEADFETWSRRGDCLFEMGRFDEAAASYDRALALRPDYGEALARRTRLGPRQAEQPGGNGRAAAS